MAAIRWYVLRLQRVWEERVENRESRRCIRERVNMAKAKKKFGVSILWGEWPDEGAKPTWYYFDTEVELNAFCYGVSEMDGWMGYEIKKIIQNSKEVE